MGITALGYLELRASSLDDWAGFGPRMLGLMLAERGQSELAFRMDDRRQRVIVSADAQDGLGAFGWEVADGVALDAMAARLEAAGIAVARGARALADRRRVADLIVTQDPLGNRIEIFHGPEVTDRAFVPGRAISGFRTGPLGMGHAVLTVPRIDDVLPFYRDILGFGLSDWVEQPFRATFMHVNGRHHSLALIETGKAGMHHLMMELLSLDDVGQGYDLAMAEEGRVATTLGRHTNDWMTSFYARTPGGFLVEYGWGGRHIEPGTWKAERMDSGPSLWGHDRHWAGRRQWRPGGGCAWRPRRAASAPRCRCCTAHVTGGTGCAARRSSAARACPPLRRAFACCGVARTASGWHGSVLVMSCRSSPRRHDCRLREMTARTCRQRSRCEYETNQAQGDILRMQSPLRQACAAGTVGPIAGRAADSGGARAC
jgi:2,3-dihydroxybiphenyl 1,2-dioxygenase